MEILLSLSLSFLRSLAFLFFFYRDDDWFSLSFLFSFPPSPSTFSSFFPTVAVSRPASFRRSQRLLRVFVVQLVGRLSRWKVTMGVFIGLVLEGGEVRERRIEEKFGRVWIWKQYMLVVLFFFIIQYTWYVNCIFSFLRWFTVFLTRVVLIHFWFF